MDTIIRGGFAGFIATIPYIAISWLLYLLGLFPSTTIHYGAVLITPPGTPLTSLPLVLGLIAVFIGGSFAGVLIAYILQWTGNDYVLLKSVGIALVLWIVHNKILPSLLDPELFQVVPPSMIVQSIFLSGLWGLITGYICLLLGNKVKT